jgi:MFS family permease
MALAPLLALRVSKRVSIVLFLLGGTALMGVATALCGLAPTLVFALLAQGGVGVGNGVKNIADDTLLQRSVPRALLGRIFGVAYALPYLALLITYGAGSLLLQLFSPRAIFLIAGIGTLAVPPYCGRSFRVDMRL